jgi:hypothetical protein
MALEFDPTKPFSDHIAEFRKHLEVLDPECAQIFLEAEAALLGDGNPERARANRTAFNKLVLEKLTALLQKDTPS